MRRRLNGPLILGMLLAAGLVALVVLARFMVPQAPPRPQSGVIIFSDAKPLAPGVDGHPLGTTRYGADVLQQLLVDAWPTLKLAIGVMLGRVLLAVPLGLLAGWYGRRLGWIVGALASVFTAVPTMIFAIAATGALTVILTRSTAQPNLLLQWSGYMVLIFAGFPRLAQQVRLLTEGIKTQPYMESAVAVGASTPRILGRHVLPGMYGDLLVTMAAETAWVLMLSAQMAVFDQPIAQSWATEFGSGIWQLRTAPWVALYPALALGLAVACFQFLAEGLRRVWAERA